jgi:hypothetical protein
LHAERNKKKSRRFVGFPPFRPAYCKEIKAREKMSDREVISQNVKVQDAGKTRRIFLPFYLVQRIQYDSTALLEAMVKQFGESRESGN